MVVIIVADARRNCEFLCTKVCEIKKIKAIGVYKNTLLTRVVVADGGLGTYRTGS